MVITTVQQRTYSEGKNSNSKTEGYWKAKGLNTDYITAMWFILCMYRMPVITDTHLHSIQGATSGDRRPSGATSLTAVKEYIPEENRG